MEKYNLPKLPYGYADLEPYISKEIMELHHGKHHATYLANLNTAIEKHPELFGKKAEDLLKDLAGVPEDIRMAVKNNGGGYVNHSLFWETMRPSASGGGGAPTGKLAEEIKKTFGNFADFKKRFEEEGMKRFGSGWVWLAKDRSGKLQIISTANQDSPISEGLTPILINDVWEHAYYLQYKNLRVEYLKAWWNVVDWQQANDRFLKKIDI